MIVLTLQRVLDANAALGRVAAQPWPIKVAYAIARTIRALEPDVAEFNKQRADLITRLGASRPTRPEEAIHGPEVVEVLPDNRAEFQRAIADLLTVEVRIDRAPIHLPADVAATITAADVLALDAFLVLDDDASTDTTPGSAVNQRK